MTELTQEQKLVIRAANRERKRKQRERDKQKRIRALEAQKAAIERGERTRRNLHFFAEVSPGRNSTTLEDELAVHREFLRALGEEDVKAGESLRDIARRTFSSWLRGPFAYYSDEESYAPGFSRIRQEFDAEYGYVLRNVSFETDWSSPRGIDADQPIDISTLPELPKVSRSSKKEPTEAPPEIKATPSAVVTPPAPPPPTSISFAWNIPRSASNYLNG